MQARFTQTYVNSLKPADKPYWISDTGCQNLRLYIGSSGKVWYALYRDANGKRQSHKIGSASALTVAQAREEAVKITARVISGESVKKEKPEPTITYGDFLKEHYESWVTSSKKTGKETMQMLTAAFGFLFSTPIEDISIIEVEQWRTKQTQEGRKAATTNRYITALKASLNWAVQCDIIKENPLARLKLRKEYDSDVKIRYLTDDERKRFMAALNAREAEMRAARTRHNEWASEREYELLPEITGEYADYLKPMILVALNTGIRQDNLFSLKWGDIDFSSQTIMLRAAVTKPGKTLYPSINSVAVKVLSAWRDQSPNTAADALVFPSPKSGGKFTNCKSSWEALLKDAQIENFRWHDMRHDFASQLVMQGVDLNTVRELMGHASLAMTLRYAHLAPQNKLRAAEVLSKFYKGEKENSD
jgi:integrase